MRRLLGVTAITVLFFILCGPALAAERFPPPDFEQTQHQLPSPTVPGPRENLYEYIDVVVLLGALALASYFVIKKRSRKAIFGLMLFSLAYFGFWRQGCVCPIGAVQNVALSTFDAGYAMPITVTLFFILPLVFALFVGRVFCGSVCPLGAIQDVLVLKPVSIPSWLESGLRLFAYVYLACAVLFAATGSAFVVCRYDPFVSFFRLSGNLNIIIFGISVLLIGVFISRPYCRFICPYGLILRHLSRISRRRITITPDDCIKCRLCEDSCPFGAIRQPSEDWPREYYYKSKHKLTSFIILVPVLALLGGWTGYKLKNTAARAHPTVRLADRIYLEETGKVQGTTDPSTAFRDTGRKVQDLYNEASGIVSNFAVGTSIAGAFVGLSIGLVLVGLTVKRKREDYQADRGSCLACGRCFEYCPIEQVRRGNVQEKAAKY